MVSKTQNSKGQSLSQVKRPMPIQIQDPNTQPMKKVVIGDGSLERQQIMEKKSIENDTSRSKEQSRRIVVVEDESREKNESNNKNQ